MNKLNKQVELLLLRSMVNDLEQEITNRKPIAGMISYEDLTIPRKEIVTHLMSAKDLNQKELGIILPISTQTFRNIIGANKTKQMAVRTKSITEFLEAAHLIIDEIAEEFNVNAPDLDFKFSDEMIKQLGVDFNG